MGFHPAWVLPSLPLRSSSFSPLLPSVSPRSSGTHLLRACEPPPPAATTLDIVETPASSPVYTPPTYSPSSPPPPRPSSSKIPGPPPLPFVGNALDIIGKQLSELMLSYARTYGRFLKFTIVSDVLFLVSDPVAIQRVTSGNPRNYLDRWTPPGFELLLYNGKLRGLVFSQGRHWMQHRQIVGSVFRSKEFLTHFVQTAVDKTRVMIDLMWPRTEGQAVNVHQSMRMLTLDIIGVAAFGTEFGAMENGSHEIETCLSNVLHGVFDVIKTPLPLWRVMKTPGLARIDNALKRLQRVEMDLIRKRRQQLKEEQGNYRGAQKEVKKPSKSDLLGLLLSARDDARGVYFEDDDLMWDVHDVIFAGHETTASALAAAVFLIAGSPRVLSKIREEVDRVLPEGRSPTFEDVAQLKYLDMVLNEALRLYPPTALIGRHAKGADVICGYEIPAGANILLSPYVMGRLDVLWDNPEEFRPERFEPEQVAERHPMCHMPFGAGPRVCLGARMATMEAKVVLAMIFQRYNLERTQDYLEVLYDSTVSFKSGMDMVIRRRI